MELDKRKFIAVLLLRLSVVNACDKSEFAKLDCSQNNFRLAINQTCFDQHWNRGNAWTETMYLGNTNETDPCIFNVRNQSSRPVEILFTQCGVTSSFPNSTDHSQVTFKLSGIIRESLMVNSSIQEDQAVEYLCQYDGISKKIHSMQVEIPAALKIEERLVLDSEILPEPAICVESSSNSSSYTCGTNPTVGKKTLLDYPTFEKPRYAVSCILISNQTCGGLLTFPSLKILHSDPSSSNFRIESVWVGSSPGAKTIKLVDDGCAIFPADFVETHARSFYWNTFTLDGTYKIYFSHKLAMCDPNDIIYCNGFSDCGRNKGNSFLFGELLKTMTTSTIANTTTTTTTTTSATTTTTTTTTTTSTTTTTRTSPPRVVTSPNYPNNYDHNDNENYLLTADPGKHIKITFNRFSVESSSGCRFDSLTIDGVKYCGENNGYSRYPPSTIYIHSRTTTITWKTDGSERRSGFSFTWQSVG